MQTIADMDGLLKTVFKDVLFYAGAGINFHQRTLSAITV